MVAAPARAATPDDLAGLLAVEDAFRRAGESRWTLLSRETFERKIGAGEVLVAERDGEIAGYLAFSHLWGYPWIEYVRLHERHRRRGVGTALVRACEDLLRERGHSFIFSSTTDGNTAALAWHRALGFTDAGRIRWVWSAPDEIVLSKTI